MRPTTPRDRERSRTRRGFLAAVQRSPGVPANELRRELDIGWGTFYHHAARLVASNQIKLVNAGRRVLVYPQGATDDAASQSLLRGTTARRIATMMVRHERLLVREIVEEANVSPRVAYYHIQRLLAAGLIESHGDSRQFELRPTARLAFLLEATEGEGVWSPTPGGCADDTAGWLR